MSPTCVQKEVIFQIGVLGKASGADVAFERPRAAVHVHMGLKIAGRWERLGAQIALVRLLLEKAKERKHEGERLKSINSITQIKFLSFRGNDTDNRGRKELRSNQKNKSSR